MRGLAFWGFKSKRAQRLARLGFNLSEDYPVFEDKEPVDNYALTEEEINAEYALVSAMMTDEILVAGQAPIPLREGSTSTLYG